MKSNDEIAVHFMKAVIILDIEIEPIELHNG